MSELFVAESISQVYGSVHSLLELNSDATSNIGDAVLSCKIFYPNLVKIDFLVYDDGCHLRKFATNKIRCDLTETAKRISKMEIVIDRMHFKGHVDQWCRQNCNPDNFDRLKSVCIL